jgi:acyl transferase domain-containing protein/NAD(P)-dependent dehydrogenase (short-subunit alcohol dehydrogenase family)/acyl carrier protein
MTTLPQVAIVGMGCRLPGGVCNPEGLVSFLRQHGDGVVDVPKDRWNVELHYHPDPAVTGKTYVTRAGFLQQDVFSFDPAPFGISPREADYLDPQQRLLLEVSFEAFEDAGLPLESLRGSSTSVFVGGFTLDHQALAYSSQNRSLISAHTSVGASMTLLSNRISYTFDLRGPSMTVDTACSSSLVAVHLGCESILRGDAALSVVGGVTVMLSPATMVAMSKGQFLAKDGRSKTFDAAADGYGRGEGAAVVVLKRLDRALEDGDRIYAVVSATGVNQDGRTDGIALPNGEAQRELCARVLEASGLGPADISYVEAHGTGTRVGDPIEVSALGAVYAGGKRTTPLPVGSIKTNIGHLEAAAGITGLLKAALSVYHREVFPMRALSTLNPDIDFERLRMRVALQAEPLSREGAVHVAVNSFGYGGTNAHAIVSSAPRSGVRSAPRRPAESAAAGARIVPLSAASRPALRARAARLAAVAHQSLDDLAYTLARRRAHLSERAALLVSSPEELAQELQLLSEALPSERCVTGRAADQQKLLWVFTGMGPQWAGMGVELYAREPAFRQAADEADAAFRAASGWSVLAEMLRSEDVSHMASNAIAQPANFVLQVALVGLLRSYGVPAHGVLGHSVGELVAAWASGCLSLAQAGFLAFHRSRLQQRVAGRGGMLAVGLSARDAALWLADYPSLEIAAYNAPQSVAIAGDVRALTQLAGALDKREIFNRRMLGEVAYHSAHMDPLERDFHSTLAAVRGRVPNVPLYSTAYGQRVEDPTHDAAYWWANARRPVLLQQALELALSDGFNSFLEIGPHPVLSSAIKETAAALAQGARVFHCLKRKQPEQLSVQRALGDLYCAGIELDWSRLSPSGQLRELPAYAFQREHFWMETEASREARLGRPAGDPLFVRCEAGLTQRCYVDLARPALSFLYDHKIQGAVVFAGAAYIAAALSACAELESERSDWALEQISFDRALILRQAESPALLVDLETREGSFGIFARHGEEPFQPHVHGRLVRETRFTPPRAVDLVRLQLQHPNRVDVSAMYAELHALGLEYGPAFQRVAELWQERKSGTGGSVLACLQDDAATLGAFPPALLDAAFQAVLSTLEGLTAAMVPTSIEQVRWFKQRDGARWAHATITAQTSGSVRANVTLMNAAGELTLELLGVTCKALSERRPSLAQRLDALSYVDSWRPIQVAADSAAGERWALVGTESSVFALLELEAPNFGVRVQRVAVTEVDRLTGFSTVLFAHASAADDPASLEALSSLRRLVAAADAASAKLRIITRGAQPLVAEDVPDPGQAALWGFGRVIMTEHPEIDLRLIDLPGQAGCSGPVLMRLLAAQSGEEEAAVRADTTYVRRVERLALETASRRPRSVPAPEHAGAYVLSLQDQSERSDASYTSCPRPSPAAGELELQVCASALERGDERALSDAVGEALVTQRLRPFVGHVTRSGVGTSRLGPGDLCFALAAARPASHKLVPETSTLKLARAHQPAQALSYGEHILAWHALMHVAHVTPGEIVVVQDAGSMLGEAVVRVARALGTRVFAASASGELRAHAGLEAERCYALPSLEFVETIRGDASAQEIAVVVSTVSGPAQDRSLALLAPGGRFIALRTRRESDTARLDLMRARNVSVSLVDLESLVAHQSERFAQASQAVAGAFEDGSLVLPEAPGFRASQAAEALQALRELERVALDFSARDATVLVGTDEAPLFRKDRSYLVTGGLSGFGLATAEWLAQNGAGHIVLGSRRGQADEVALAALQHMARAGASVECERLDVTDAASVHDLLLRIAQRRPPLAGVFHSAMELDDRPLLELTDSSLRKVLLPKAIGAYHLYQSTRDVELDYFVLYSSISASVGNPRQASYAAANAFLEALAHKARAEGRNACAIAWGALGDVGVVARDKGTAAHLEALGIKPIPAKVALEGLGRVLRQGHACASLVDMQWNKWAKAFPSTPWHRLTQLRTAEHGEQDGNLAALCAELRGRSAEDQLARASEHVRAATSRVIRMTPEQLDDTTSLRNYGVDSLMALELQSELHARTGVTISSIQILAGVSVAELSSRILAAALEGPSEAADPVQSGASLPREAAALREHFLARICVQPPYFDLRELSCEGEWVEAVVRPLPPSAEERDVVSCAEAARHLAIVGSCAVSLRSGDAGKVYYPVLRASYPALPQERASRALLLEDGVLKQARVRARCTSFDRARARASAETELLDLAGNLVTKLQVEYHVIPQAEFARLFADRAQPTEEASGLDPYEAWGSLPPMSKQGDEFVMELGPVAPVACLGHFVGYPALPVSIMTRYAIRLLVEAARLESGWRDAQVRVVSGLAETQSFVFAGEQATLTARRLPDSGPETWRCEVKSADKVAASFELSVELERPRVSGLQTRLHTASRAVVA